MPFFALRSGQTTSPRPLLAILKEAHQDLVDAAEADRKTREESGAPIDGDALKPPPQWIDRPELADIRISFKAVSHETYLEAVLSVSQAYREISETEQGNLKEMLSSSSALQSAMADFVSKAVASVEGFEDEDGPYTLGSQRGLTLNDIQTIKAAGILGDLYAAAKRYQELDAAGKKHCGLRQQPTCQNSNATSAQDNGGSLGDATEGQLGGQEQSMSTTPAQGDILYVTGGYQRPLISTTPREVEKAGWTA